MSGAADTSKYPASEVPCLVFHLKYFLETPTVDQLPNSTNQRFIVSPEPDIHWITSKKSRCHLFFHFMQSFREKLCL